MTGFLDTNVLLYAFEAGSDRARRARDLLHDGNQIGVQSLNEFALVARRRLGMQWPEIEHALGALQTLFPSPVSLTLDIHRMGIGLAQRYRQGIYDSMLLAAALDARCDTFWSEDLHDGLLIDGRLVIRNPFA